MQSGVSHTTKIELYLAPALFTPAVGRVAQPIGYSSFGVKNDLSRSLRSCTEFNFDCS